MDESLSLNGPLTMSSGSVNVHGSAWFGGQMSVGSDFGAKLCLAWENEALKANIRTCILRTGLVLDSSGGIFKKMQLPFKLGLGGCIGDG